ncbi:MAG: uroporphyrinogen-III synthase [Ilumatobacter sp.]
MPGKLNGFVIGVTADRRSAEQISMFEGRGAACIHGPTIRTHPLRPEAEILEATQAFLEAPVDIVVLTTGIGVRGWLEAAESVLLGDELRVALSSALLVSRGPKARGAAVTAELDVAWNAPNATSDEVVDYLVEVGVRAKRVAVQLDGSSGGSMVDKLTELGAEVVPIPVYRWSIPDDLAPAQSLVRAVCDRRVDGVTFTARPAVENFAAIASSMERWDDVVAACADHVRLFCIGPVCARGVIETGLGTPEYSDRSRLGAMAMFVTSALGDQHDSYTVGGYEIVLKGRTVGVDGAEPVVLTGRERQVLDALLDRPGVVCSKQALLSSIWGRGETDTHVVEVTVGRLRQRLGSAGVGIETVIRRGYRASPV